LLILPLLLPVFQGGDLTGLQPLAVWFGLIFAALLIMTASFTAADLLANEGQTINLIRAQPVPMAALLRVKLLVTWLPLMTAWTVCVGLLTLLYRLAPWEMALLWSVAALGLGIGLAVAVGIAARYTDFAAGRLPLLPGLSILLLNGLWAVVLFVLAAWVIAFGVPESNSAAALTALHIGIDIGWIVPLLVFGAVFIMITVVLWRRGVRHLL